MPSTTTPPYAVKTVPSEIVSSDQLELWLARQKLPVGEIDQLPPDWRVLLSSLPRGIIARPPGSTQLVRWMQGDFSPVAPAENPLSGQAVFFAMASA